MPNVKYKIGDIVTILTHPMAFQKDGIIDSFVSHIPPLMCIKEIHVERKKEMFSKESSSKKISDNVKYLCTYFNQHRCTFEDKMVYQEMLISFEKLKFHRKTDNVDESHKTLIEETLDYKIADYIYGDRVFFKTYKLEKRKTFKNSTATQAIGNKSLMVHTSPAFAICGFKKNENQCIYDSKNGSLIQKKSPELYKVLWYDSYQEKMKEDYQPKEFFIRDAVIYETSVPQGFTAQGGSNAQEHSQIPPPPSKKIA